MIREKLKQKMLADERLRVPIYQELPFWLDQDCREMVELVNDTGSVASLLFEPEGTLIQQRLGFVPHVHDRNEVSFLVEGFNRLYQMTAEDSVKKTNTEAQQTQRNKISVLSKFLPKVVEVLRVGAVTCL